MENEIIDYRELGPILIVDDEVSITNALQRILGKNFKIIIANTLDEATNLLDRKEFPIILLDYELGENIDGVIFSKYINNMYPRSYIIMLTGYKDFSIVKRAINEGSINYFVHKPIDAKKLKEIIKESYDKYKNNVQLSTFLKNPQGLEKAKSLLSDVISSKLTKDNQQTEYEITGIVVSRGSIPVYSKFYREEIFNSFTDTLFAGFMSALVMVGDEIFSMSQGVDSLRFNKISIYFKFIKEYQISFIIFTPSEVDSYHIDEVLSSFTDKIQIEIEKDSLFFGWQNKCLPIMDKLLHNLEIAL